MENNSINLNETNLKTAIRVMMAESNVDSLAALARDLGLKETTLRSAVNNNAVRVADFVKLSEHMGYEIIVRERAK